MYPSPELCPEVARVSQHTDITALNNINWLVFLTQGHCVRCEVRTESLHIIPKKLVFERKMVQVLVRRLLDPVSGD